LEQTLDKEDSPRCWQEEQEPQRHELGPTNVLAAVKGATIEAEDGAKT